MPNGKTRTQTRTAVNGPCWARSQKVIQHRLFTAVRRPLVRTDYVRIAVLGVTR